MQGVAEVGRNIQWV